MKQEESPSTLLKTTPLLYWRTLWTCTSQLANHWGSQLTTNCSHWFFFFLLLSRSKTLLITNRILSGKPISKTDTKSSSGVDVLTLSALSFPAPDWSPHPAGPQPAHRNIRAPKTCNPSLQCYDIWAQPCNSVLWAKRKHHCLRPDTKEKCFNNGCYNYYIKQL